jgi:hypothetical protein
VCNVGRALQGSRHLHREEVPAVDLGRLEWQVQQHDLGSLHARASVDSRQSARTGQQQQAF